MSEYGLKRLVLLHSANYERAEIPLDDSVSIIGPNNAGKTSLINALQFLLISDRRQMDWGAHDESATMRFYFPGPSSFILLEAQLESGLAVLGCVGKGASHECQHFAYMGSLHLEDFRRPDGSLVQEKDLREHMSALGRSVQYFSRSSEFFDALYGRAGRRSAGDLDLRLYKLESPGLKSVFQKILVRTLRLDKLQAQDVKDFMLQIFTAEHGLNIDFHKIWHRAFDSVNADRLQYQACRKQEERLLSMESYYQGRLGLRGRIATMRPQIDAALLQWESHRKERQRFLQEEQSRLSAEEDRLDKEAETLVEERKDNQNALAALKSQEDRLKTLEAEYALVQGESELTTRQEEVALQLSKIRYTLENTQNGSLAQKERDLNNKRDVLERLRLQLEHGEKLLGTRLRSLLSPEEMDVLNGLVQEGLFHWEAQELGDLEAFAQGFKAFSRGQAEALEIWGLRLPLSRLKRPYRVQSAEELKQEWKVRQQELAQLEQEVAALKDKKLLEGKRDALLREESMARKALEEYQDLQALRSAVGERQGRREELEKRQALIESLREELKRQKKNTQEEKALQERLQKELGQQSNAIAALRGQRRDHDAVFQNLSQLPHTPWFQSRELGPEGLDLSLREQNADCDELLKTDSRLREILRDAFHNGFTKFQNIAEEDEQIRLMLNYVHSLDQEDATLQRAVRSAVTDVARSLKELERQFGQFQTFLHKFNHLIGKRRLSDLERFRIELREHPYLLDAIRTLLRSSEAIEKLQSGDLFDTLHAESDSVGDQDLDRAKEHLLKYSKDNGTLKIDHLFDLDFEVAKKGQAAQRFDQLDKIGSNGTVLMAKLISGLALLYQMLDKAHQAETICYLDEAASLDDANQESLISTAREFGFNLLFASPTPQTTVRYCVPITKSGSKNLITRKHWQIFDSLEEAP